MYIEEIEKQTRELIARLNDASTTLKNAPDATKEHIELVEKYTLERDKLTEQLKDLNDANKSN